MKTIDALPSTPHQVVLCESCGLAVVRLTGCINGDDLADLVASLMRADAWDPARNDLWNVQAVTDLFVTSTQAQRLAALRAEACADGGQGRTALVTRTTSQRAYGIVLLQSLCAASHPWRCFRSEKRAVRWLRKQPHPEGDATTCDGDCVLGGTTAEIATT